MKRESRRFLALLTIVVGLGVCSTQGSFASSGADGLGSEESLLALGRTFSLPMKFSTDLGELSLTVQNSADEEDMHYLRPLSFPDPSEFLFLSHKQFLKKIDVLLAEEDDERAQALEGIANSGLLPKDLQVHYVDTMLPYRRSAQSEPCDLGSQFKRPKILIDNPIFPLRYQRGDFNAFDKFAFPNSVLTLNWSFEFKDSPRNYADLNLFQDSKLFYLYVQNTFLEFLKKQSADIEEQRFKEIRPYMYL